jgi:hypothetical protein
LEGAAMDIPFSGFTTAKQKAVISQLLADPRVNGFGYYPDRGTIHVDIRNGKRYAWGENYSWTSMGKGWPQWLTDQVLEWWPDAPIQPRTQKRKPQ